MNSDYYDLLFRLVDAKVDFVVVGDYAAIAYGYENFNQGLDICCCFEPDNLVRLYAAVAGLNPVHRMTPNRRRFELTPETVHAYRNLYLDTDAGQLDCISEVKGVGAFEQVKQRSRTMTIQNRAFRVLDLDALIASKKAMGRPRDVEMVRHLETLGRLAEKQNHSKS